MRTKWLVLGVLVWSIPFGNREGLAQERLFFDAVEVKVASVEVVVEDGDGKKISGLTADDFEILEDGVRQEIAYFSAQENGQIAARADSDAAGEAPATTERLHLAIFLDDVHLAPQNRNRVFERLQGYLDNSLKPSDLVLIARISDRLVIEQPFTADVAALKATLDRLVSTAGSALAMDAGYRRLLREIASTALTDQDSAPAVRSLQAEQKISEADSIEIAARNQARDVVALGEDRRMRVNRTLASLKTAVGSLAGLRGRKALIFLSDGLPIRPAESLADAWRDKYEQWATRNNKREMLDELTRATSLGTESQSELNDLAKQASASRVAFYVLSPGSTVSRGISGAEISGAGSGGASIARTAASTEAFEGEAALLQLAETTGGKARTRNLDIESLLNGVREDFGTFYSLGYNPKTEAQGGVRPVKVKLKGRPDATVRYTRHLGDEDPVDQLRQLTLSALYHGLTENPLKIELEPKPAELTGNDSYRVDVLVKIPFEKLLLLPQEENHVGRLTLFVVVQDHKSQNLSTMSRVELPLKIPNEDILAVMTQKAAYPLQLEMKGGSQRLAIGIRDHLARVSATVELDVVVPDSLAAAVVPPVVPPAAPAAAEPAGGDR